METDGLKNGNDERRPGNREQGGQGGRRNMDRKKGGGGPGRGKPRHPHSGGFEGKFDRQGPSAWRDEQYIKEKLSEIKEPVLELSPLNFKESKFQSRCRLYVTNLPSKVTKEEFTELFTPYGEVDDIYLHKEFFGFARMDYYYNALKAKTMLDNTMFKDKNIKVKFSPTGSILVKNLPPFVSNELVYLAFSVFGEVDYCSVLTDARGHALDQAVVDYKYKRCVPVARKYCNEHFYLLTASLKPVTVEECSVPYDDDGIPEDSIKKSPAFFKTRQRGPRFAVPGSFEYKYAEKFKQLLEQVNEKTAEIQVHKQQAEHDLELESVEAEFDYETERLKDLLMQREMEREHLRRSKRGSDFGGINNSEEERWHMRREGMDERGFKKDECFFEKPREFDNMPAAYPNEERDLNKGRWVSEKGNLDEEPRKNPVIDSWADKPNVEVTRDIVDPSIVAAIIPEVEKEGILNIEPPPHIDAVEDEARGDKRHTDRHHYDDRSREYDRRGYQDRNNLYEGGHDHRDRGKYDDRNDYERDRSLENRYRGWVQEDVPNRGRKRQESIHPVAADHDPWGKRSRY